MTPDQVRVLDLRLKLGTRRFAEGAGLRFKSQSGAFYLRSDPSSGPLVAVDPLQDKRGMFRADASNLLTVAGLENLPVADKVTEMVEQQGGWESVERDTSAWALVQLLLLSKDDPLPVLQGVLADNPNVRFYRLRSTETLSWRLAFLRVMDQLCEGVRAADILPGKQLTEHSLVSGLVELGPGLVITGPLVARSQPLAVVLHTTQGAEIAALPAAGGFLRSMVLVDRWPVGFGHPSLQHVGTGKAIYQTGSSTIPAGHAAAMLRDLTTGANKLLAHLTDPTHWLTASGCFDREERWINWSSVLFGLEAIASLGADWGSRSAPWAALRALGTLQGIWEGHRQGGVPLRNLLDPRHIQNYVVPTIGNDFHREWVKGVTNNYQRDIERTFPNEGLDSSLKKLEEVRHLIHGVGGQGPRSRGDRLNTLRSFSAAKTNLQLLADIATFWWSGAILGSDRLCTPGKAPWE